MMKKLLIRTTLSEDIFEGEDVIDSRIDYVNQLYILKARQGDEVFTLTFPLINVISIGHIE